MSSPPRALGVLCALGLLASCTATREPEPSSGAQESPVVYGNDDRQDYYESDSELFRQRTRESIVALIPSGALDRSNPDDIQIVAPTLQQSYSLCDDQRFLDQPTAANCSGTLIDDDLVLTAGHCAQSDSACRGYAYVFNYYYAAEGELRTITSDDVYACEELVVQALSGGFDYAILRLDRPVVGGHAPAPVRREVGPLAAGDGVPVVGFGSGLPAKIDLGGTVLDPRSSTLDYFVASPDTFGGNSGSGVFNEAGDVVGILVRGETDYVPQGDCNVVNELPDPPGAGRGEDVSYVGTALDALCLDSGFPSARLCGGPTGEGWCDPCDAADACPDGWECGPSPDLEGTWCALPCGGAGDCRDDHSCVGGFCRPNRSARCSEGDVWLYDACGRRVLQADDCTPTEVCSNGGCVARPAGDACTDPTPIEPVTQTLTGNLTAYFPDSTGSCAGAGPDRVFTFTLDDPARLDAVATGYDTVLYVRQSCGDATTERVCNDDANPPGSYGSHIAVSLERGTYYLFLDAWSDSVGAYTLDLTFDYDFEPPAGDTCSSATVISPVNQTLTGDLNADYANDYRGSCAGGGPERVYRFTLDQPMRVTALASGFDTVLYLRSSCGDGSSELACNDDIQSGQDRRSQIQITLEPGTYFLFMDAWSQDVGTYTLALTFDSLECDPACEVGQRRCLGADLQTCAPNVLNCPVWVVTSCGSGRTCVDGACVAGCTDTCPEEGLTECVGDATWRSCGQFDDDDCLEWGGMQRCPSETVCEGGVCHCLETCRAGARRCNGAVVEECLATGAACNRFAPVETCGAGTVCADGQCLSTCTEVCEPGARRCNDRNVELCEVADSGCFQWVDLGECGDEQACLDGECVGCTDACDFGTRQCTADGAAVERCEVGPGGCTQWRLAERCGDAAVCEAGECTALCTDACEEGARRCTDDGSAIERCDARENGCTAWVVGPSCEGLGGCSDGECVGGCLDECLDDGGAECVTGTSYRECGDFDDDGCLEWHLEVDCFEGETCVGDGQCTAACEDDGYEPNNEPGEAQLVDPGFLAELVACSDDEDWFAIGVLAGERLLVSVTPLDTEAGDDLDVELYLEDALDTPIAAGRTPGSEVERVRWTAPEAAVVLVRVVVADASDGVAPYDLSLTLGPAPEDECLEGERRCSETANGLEKCELAEDGRYVWSEPDLCGTGRTCLDGACAAAAGPGPNPDAGDASIDVPGGDGFEQRPLATNGCGCAVGGPDGGALVTALWPLALVAGWWRRRRRR